MGKGNGNRLADMLVHAMPVMPGWNVNLQLLWLQ
jgi:hypothetical protein